MEWGLSIILWASVYKTIQDHKSHTKPYRTTKGQKGPHKVKQGHLKHLLGTLSIARGQKKSANASIFSWLVIKLQSWKREVIFAYLTPGNLAKRVKKKFAGPKMQSMSAVHGKTALSIANFDCCCHLCKNEEEFRDASALLSLLHLTENKMSPQKIFRVQIW